MTDWFTVDKIDSDTYAISEYKHWEETHCYLLCGTERALLIDTGLGVSNIKKIVDRLTSLPVTAIITHAHWDHMGGLNYFENFAVHEAEVDWLAAKFPLDLAVVKKNLTRLPCDFPDDFHIEKYRIFKGTPKGVLHDGECIDLGNRRLAVIHTPGHSPGHCCFYEPDRKYLYSGDLVYTGCLDAFYPTTDPLLFLHSIRKILPLEVSHILPGHHQLPVPISIVGRIEKAFRDLDAGGKLKQGGGVFDYGDFQIHI